MATKQILIAGWFGAGNVGDDLILKTEIEFLRKKYPDAQIVVLAKDPKKIEPMTGVSAFPLPPIAWYRFYRFLDFSYAYRLWKLFQKTDLFVLGGGGFFSDRQFFAIAGWLRLCRFAKWNGARVISFCIGAGPFFHEKNKQLIAKHQAVFDALLVRDAQSMENLINAGVDQSRITLAIDPVLFLRRFSTPRKREMTMILFENELFWAKRIKKIFSTTDLSVRLIATDNEDFAFNQKLFDHIDSPRLLWNKTMTTDAIVSEIAASEMVISMRLHGNIVAASQGVPFLNIWYHFKGLEFSKRLDFEAYTIEAKTINEELVEQKITNMLEENEEIRDTLLRKREELSSFQSLIFEKI